MTADAMAVSAITVGARHRHDLGDLAGLAKSIKEVGLLHPIVVDKHGALIAGSRRLRACTDILGWSEVPIRVVDIKEIVRGEFAENAERKDFLPSEIEAIRRAMAPIETAAAKERQGARTDLTSGQVARKSKPERARNKLGAFAGVSGRTIEKIAAVVKAAEEQPERFGHLVEEMDRTGKANSAFRMLRRAEDEERVKGLVVAPGRHRTLVIDPPWDYDWLSPAGRASPGYAAMS
jgi:ParB/RepB/Spo0J family partition protein